jgi:non-ribosomal peptide synthetase component F/GNAT superfamily N-acetyltransferase
MLERLSPQQRLLLAQRLRKKTESTGGLPPIPRRTDASPCPLSFSQQRLWFLDQLDPGNSAYNVYRAVRLEGELDRNALSRSFEELVARHETLRTTFRVVDGVPLQVVSPPGPVALPVIDLRGLPPAEREARVLRLANEEAHRPFRLSGGDPLLRTTLLQLGPREHVLLLTTHHVAADGWSVGILFSDLASFYEALSAGRPPQLPPLPVRYTDYAAWQRHWLEGPALAGQLTYWKRQLDGAPPFLELPTDRPRPTAQALANFRGARHYLLMPTSLQEGLTALSRRENVTLFMTLLAATKVLLCRYSGQEDVVVGSPIAGRTRPEVEGLIGCFSNTLVLRTSLAGAATFRDLVRRVRETALGAFAHADVPFEKLVEELRPRRVPNRMVLFQVNFRLLTAPPPPLKLAGLDLRFLELDNRMAKFDLAFELCTRPDGLGGYLEYFTDLFEPATIARIGKDLEELLREVVARPDAPLTALTGRPASARSQPAMQEPSNGQTPGKGLRAVQRKAVPLPADAPPSAPATQPGAGAAEPPVKAEPSYTLRKATIRDCAFIYRLRADTLGPYVSQFAGWSDEQKEAYYLDFDPAVHWIVVVDGKDVGDFGVVRTDRFIDALGIHLLPEHQNNGLGAKILKDIFKEADAKGVPVTARVIKSNRALKLWQRIGFVITGEKGQHYEITRPCTTPPPAEAPATAPQAGEVPPGADAPAAPQRPKSLREIKRKGINLSAG